MIRPILTEIGIFLIPFAVYALFLAATRSGLFARSSWPVYIVARLALVAIVLVIAGLIGMAHYSGAGPDAAYVPAHIDNGKFVPGSQK